LKNGCIFVTTHAPGFCHVRATPAWKGNDKTFGSFLKPPGVWKKGLNAAYTLTLGSHSFHQADSSSMTRNYWITIIAALAGGLAALQLGLTLEWDMLNYHLYNPHSLLSGRLGIDFAAAQLQTYLNPTLHLPLYAIFKYFGTGALVFVIGALQAAQLLILLLILEELAGRRITEPWVLLLVAILGLVGPIMINQLGGTQADTLISALVLAGLLVIIRCVNRPEESGVLKAGVISGVLLGLACALKLTMTVYAVGMALATFIWFRGSDRWKIVAGLAVGGFVGVLLAGGAWFFHLWQTYGNPIFPYFNDIFGSVWIDGRSYRDMRWMPDSLYKWLFYPVVWLMDPREVWEHEFRDIRVPILIAISLILPVFTWKRLRDDFPALGLTLLFLAFSYVLWLRMFSIYRYLAVLELLAPLVIFSTFLLWVKSRRALIILLITLVCTQALVQHHRGPGYWEVRADTPTRLIELPENAMVIIDDYEPTAYAALWLDDQVPLVRIRGNFMRTTEPRFLLHETAQNRVREHQGSYFLLDSGSKEAEAWMSADLEYVGLAPPDPELCEDVFYSETLQQRLRLKLCPLQPLGH
jgi:hypothetical protein